MIQVKTGRRSTVVRREQDHRVLQHLLLGQGLDNLADGLVQLEQHCQEPPAIRIGDMLELVHDIGRSLERTVRVGRVYGQVGQIKEQRSPAFLIMFLNDVLSALSEKVSSITAIAVPCNGEVVVKIVPPSGECLKPRKMF